MYGFLLSRRWIGFALFVVALAAVCTRLGFWQMDKLEDTLATNEVIAEHFATEPVPLDSVVAPGQQLGERDEWRQVTVTGHYDPAHEVAVKFTTRDGAPGVDVVTPLVLADGSAVLVNRGWMETQNTVERPSDVPAPPSGEVEATGWLRQNNGAGGQAVRPVDGQVRAVSSVGLADFVPADLRDGYLNLREQQPAGAGALALEPQPDLGQGPHFFYALQWWFFALLAVVGFGWFARAEAKERLSPSRIDGFVASGGPGP